MANQVDLDASDDEEAKYAPARVADLTQRRRYATQPQEEQALAAASKKQTTRARP